MDRESKIQFANLAYKSGSHSKVPAELWNDIEFVLEAVRRNGRVLAYVPRNLIDKEIALGAVKNHCAAIIYVPKELKSDSDILNIAGNSILERIDKNLNYMDYAPLELRSSTDFMAKAAQINVYALSYATDEVAGDPDFMLKQIQENKRAFDSISNQLKNNKSFLMSAVNENGSLLNRFTDKHLVDKDIILSAVNAKNSKCSYILEDQDFMLKAIKKDASVMEIVSPGLKGDMYFFAKAVKENIEVSKFMPDNLRANKGYIGFLARKNCDVLQYFPDLIKDDEFMKEAVALNSDAKKYLTGNQKPSEKETQAKDAGKENESAVQDVENLAKYQEIQQQKNADAETAKGQVEADDKAECKETENENTFELKNTEIHEIQDIEMNRTLEEKERDREVQRQIYEIIKEAEEKFNHNESYEEQKTAYTPEDLLAKVKDNVNVLVKASPECLLDKNFMSKAIEQNPNALFFAPDSLKADPKFMFEIASKNIATLFYASDSLKENSEFMSKMTDINVTSLHYASDSLKSSKKFMMQEIGKESFATYYLSSNLQKDPDIQTLMKVQNGDIELMDSIEKVSMNDVNEYNAFVSVAQDVVMKKFDNVCDSKEIGDEDELPPKFQNIVENDLKLFYRKMQDIKSYIMDKLYEIVEKLYEIGESILK